MSACNPCTCYRGDEQLAQSVWDIVNALKRCSKSRDLVSGKRLHLKATASGSGTNKYVATALITMYGKCGSMACARDIFDGTIDRDVVVWNSLILGYAENGQSITAIELFMGMEFEPDTFTFVAVLKACGSLGGDKGFHRGVSVHRRIHQQGLASNVLVANTLLDVYRKCGAMKLARDVFDALSQRNVVSWNCLLLGYVENGESRLAVEFFSCMDLQPDNVTYLAVLKACTTLASNASERQSALVQGAAVHKQIKDAGLESSLFVANALVDMYSKCGDMSKARDVFERMQTRDVISWNCLIMGYADSGQSSVALDLFTSIDCEPSVVTFLAALKACGNMGSHIGLKAGTDIHRRVSERGLVAQVAVANTLLDMYRKCKRMQSAREVFNGLKEKTAVSWTCLILGYVDSGESSVALDLYMSMDCEPDCLTFVAAVRACTSLALEKKSLQEFCLRTGAGIHERVRERGYDSDTVVSSAFVELYSRCGDMTRAQETFDRMVRRDAVSWTSLILGYLENGQGMKAIDVFMSMDCEPDSLTFVAVLKACGTLGAVVIGKRIHARVCKLGLEEDEMVGNSLVNLYGKVGNMPAAEHLLSCMSVGGIVPWNALIAGYTMVGNTSRVFQLGDEVREAGLQMNDITFICILTACNHAGAVELGKQYFEFMSEQGVSPSVDHYNCMVDMLCRANRLREALSTLQSMPFEANSVTWMTLLGACRKWKNTEVGRVAFDALVKLQHVKVGEDFQSCFKSLNPEP